MKKANGKRKLVQSPVTTTVNEKRLFYRLKVARSLIVLSLR